MSAEKHTRGRLAADGHVVLFSDNAGGFDISACPSPEANARRLVACWNACDGIPTADLEQYAALDGVEHETVARLRFVGGLVKQRDELLSDLVEARHALQMANDTPNGPISDTIWMMHRPETLFDFIDAAIAKVKGGAA